MRRERIAHTDSFFSPPETNFLWGLNCDSATGTNRHVRLGANGQFFLDRVPTQLDAGHKAAAIAPAA
jgi:hypothetical protein